MDKRKLGKGRQVARASSKPPSRSVGVPEWEKVFETLAGYCKLSKQSLYAYAKKPGFPPEDHALGWNVANVQTFVAANGTKEEVIAANDTEYAELKRLDLFERWRKTKLSNDKTAGTLILKSFMDSQLAAMASAVTAHLTTRGTRVAPDLAGRSIPECERIIKESDREILRALAARVKKNAAAS